MRTVDLLAYQRIPLVRGTRARGKLRKRVTHQDAYSYWRITLPLVRGDESPRAPACIDAPIAASYGQIRLAYCESTSTSDYNSCKIDFSTVASKVQ
jgi:hypothetical protein